jgi:ACS family glucarate transporter-like MFS transporter
VKPAERPTRRRYILVGLVFLHTFNTYLDRVCISAAAGDIKSDLAISDQMMGHIFAMFAIGYALFQIPAGWVADKFGPRGALTWIVSVWSVFTCLSGAAFNAGSLLIVRFLFGIGEAGAFPGATRAMYAWMPARERGIARVRAQLPLVDKMAKADYIILTDGPAAGTDARVREVHDALVRAAAGEPTGGA